MGKRSREPVVETPPPVAPELAAAVADTDAILEAAPVTEPAELVAPVADTAASLEDVPVTEPAEPVVDDARLAAESKALNLGRSATARETFSPAVVIALNEIPKLKDLRAVEAWVEANPEAASLCGMLPSFTRFPPDSMPSPDVLICADDEVMVIFRRGPDGRFNKSRLSR